MSTLVIAEYQQNKLSAATLSTITAALQLQQPVDLLVLGTVTDVISGESCNVHGLRQVLVATDTGSDQLLAERIIASVMSVAKSYRAILAPANTFGKNFLPRVAALFDEMVISDVMQIVDGKTFVRPIYAGNALATVQTHREKIFLTIRPTAFAPTESSAATVSLQMIAWEVDPALPAVEFVSQTASIKERPELTSAKIVVSGGRALQNAENFKLIEQLADCLGAAVGASRAAVDAGYISNDYQVGQTGKVVAPNLYIAVGISGAIQHLAGMKDSKVIVAINKDPEAPIFQVADYGLVADLFVAVPEMIQLLS